MLIILAIAAAAAAIALGVGRYNFFGESVSIIVCWVLEAVLGLAVVAGCIFGIVKVQPKIRALNEQLDQFDRDDQALCSKISDARTQLAGIESDLSQALHEKKIAEFNAAHCNSLLIAPAVVEGKKLAKPDKESSGSARVFIDGVELGIATQPYSEFKLQPGEHTLTVILYGKSESSLDTRAEFEERTFCAADDCHMFLYYENVYPDYRSSGEISTDLQVFAYEDPADFAKDIHVKAIP
ncbi:MAG: hypothetical protein LUH51_06480 [Firmicutes bacterium]|nr:hypothetical protein [Bacillota bacterium]